MPYKHDVKSSGQVIRADDWNTMGHALESVDANKINRAGDTIQGDLSVTGKLIAQSDLSVTGKLSGASAQFSSSLGCSAGLDVVGAANLHSSLNVAGGAGIGSNAPPASGIQVKSLLRIDEGATAQGAWCNFGSNAFYDGAWKQVDPSKAGVNLHMNAEGGGAEFRFLRIEPNGQNARNIATIGSNGLVAQNICAGGAFRIGRGQTPPGSTAWQVYSPNGVFVDVDTKAAGFTATPVYVACIGGNSSHWATTGGSSVYSASNVGFRIYVKWSDNSALVPATANANGWHILWIGIQA